MTRGATAPARDWRESALAGILSPMQRFIRSESASGIALITVTMVALVVANSPLAGAYHALLELEIGIEVGSFALRESLLHWINDGLMALFFFLVGLELKREAVAGELASPRQALLPALAALGGAAVPAIIYTLINLDGPGAAGWGVPMATDIAFALGILALLGSRVPWTLKVFLTAIAVLDDLLAVLVIALFYSSELNLVALGIGLALLGILLLLNYLGIRALAVYIVIGLAIWLAFFQSGVHATIAGVLVALTIPARNRIDADHFLTRVGHYVDQFKQGGSDSPSLMTDEHQQSAVVALEDACEAVQAPLQRMEHGLHNWVAFGIMPLFALANAGVTLSLGGMTGETLPVMLGIVFGLVLGKPIGLIATTWLAVRLGLGTLPQGMTWHHVVGVGCLAGLGFTMSLFIATLGFADLALLDAAKLGILSASVIAGVVGFVVLRQAAPAPNNSSTQAGT